MRGCAPCELTLISVGAPLYLYLYEPSVRVPRFCVTGIRGISTLSPWTRSIASIVASISFLSLPLAGGSSDPDTRRSPPGLRTRLTRGAGLAFGFGDGFGFGVRLVGAPTCRPDRTKSDSPHLLDRLIPTRSPSPTRPSRHARNAASLGNIERCFVGLCRLSHSSPRMY